MSWRDDKPEGYIYKRGPYKKTKLGKQYRNQYTKKPKVFIVVYEDDRSITRELTRIDDY